MTALSDVFEASFRKVPFYVRRSSTTGGRRTVTHEFVNSNFREVEDLGVNLKKFNISAFVTSQRDANKLVEALEKKGSAVLSHPFFGKHTVRLNGAYSVDNNMKNLGEINFNLSFAIKLEKFVSKKVSTLDSIRNKAASVSDSIGLDTAKEYFNSGIAAINATTDFVNEVSDKIESVSEIYSQAIGTVSSLVSSVQGIRNNVVNLLNLPGRMASDLGGLIGKITDVFDEKKQSYPDISPSLTQDQQDILGNTQEVSDDIENTREKERKIQESVIPSSLDSSNSDISQSLFTSLEALFDHNKESIRVSEILSASGIDLSGSNVGVTSSANTDIGNLITNEEAEIINNEKLLTRLIRIGALSSAYVAATEIDYISIAAIEESQQKLETQYQSVISDLSIPRQTIGNLQQLRDAAELYFFEQKITANQLVNIRINTMPAQVIVFMLHGSTDLVGNIISLNEEINVSSLSGDISVLTA